MRLGLEAGLTAPASSALFLPPGCLPLPEHRALSEAAGGVHLGEEMMEFTGTHKQAVKVFTLHTISCRVFTSGLAAANVQSQPGSNLVLSAPPHHESSPSSRPVYVSGEGKLERMSAESLGSPAPP